jgi:hypothetical protein
MKLDADKIRKMMEEFCFNPSHMFFSDPIYDHVMRAHTEAKQGNATSKPHREPTDGVIDVQAERVGEDPVEAEVDRCMAQLQKNCPAVISLAETTDYDLHQAWRDIIKRRGKEDRILGEAGCLIIDDPGPNTVQVLSTEGEKLFEFPLRDAILREWDMSPNPDISVVQRIGSPGYPIRKEDLGFSKDQITREQDKQDAEALAYVEFSRLPIPESFNTAKTLENKMNKSDPLPLRLGASMAVMAMAAGSGGMNVIEVPMSRPPSEVKSSNRKMSPIYGSSMDSGFTPGQQRRIKKNRAKNKAARKARQRNRR